MIEYKPITLEDRKWAEPILKKAGYPACDYNFTVGYTWSGSFHGECALHKGFYLYRSGLPGRKGNIFPVGEGDPVPVIRDMIEYCREHDEKLWFYSVLPEQKEIMEKNFPDQFIYKSDRDYSDYIYLTEKLSTLSGKKLHAKRNHVNRFMKDHPDFYFEEISPENIEKVKEFNEKWYLQNADDEDISFRHEMAAARETLDNYFDLDVKGAVLGEKDQIFAYTIGEKITPDMYVIHIEKADADVAGAYTVINQQFAEKCCSDSTYINREDDAGEEGLRKAKLSYYPEKLLEKYMVAYKENY